MHLLRGFRFKLLRFEGLAINTVRTERLEIAFEDGGPPDGPPVMLLHVWPDTDADDTRC